MNLWYPGANGVLGWGLYDQALYQPVPKVAPMASSFIERDTSTNVILVPVPKSVAWTQGVFRLGQHITLSAPADDQDRIAQYVEQQLTIKATPASGGSWRFVKRQDLGNEAYHLSVKPAGITLEYGQLAVVFYGLTTIRQLAMQSGDTIPCVDITDQPDLAIRGFLLDISRDKVPTLETLYGVVDYLSMLKYNHLQLYIEGFAFAYPSFRALWETTETPLTGEEIEKLDAYCRDRFIELVPNQNSLGHMAAWLATDQFKDLAECPDGYAVLGLWHGKTTLALADPRSLALVKQMSEELLPHFTSTHFNINLDEPFELGRCRSKARVKKEGLGKVYMDYAMQMNDYVKSKGKKMMMWGDVVTKHPEIMPSIPKDITLIEWGYEANHPFKKNCQAYRDAGLRYLVAPGTSSWASLTGRTTNMLGNIANAVGNAIAYKAAGMLLTDWGDLGHWQPLPVSYAGIAYGAALSWNYGSKDQVPLARFLSESTFRDDTGLMGDFVLNMGRYNQYEEIPVIGTTTTAMAYQFGMVDKVILDALTRQAQPGITAFIEPDETAMSNALTRKFHNAGVYHHRTIIDYTSALAQDLLRAKINRSDSATIKDEYRNSIRLIQLGATLKQYINDRNEQSPEENQALLREMHDLSQVTIREFERVWHLRHKRSGIARSIKPLYILQEQINKEMAWQHTGGLARFFKRTKEKVISAGTVIYLHIPDTFGRLTRMMHQLKQSTREAPLGG